MPQSGAVYFVWGIDWRIHKFAEETNDAFFFKVCILPVTKVNSNRYSAFQLKMFNFTHFQLSLTKYGFSNKLYLLYLKRNV